MDAASVGVATLGPLMGRIMDSVGPVRLCVLSFAVIAFYPLALAAAGLQSMLAPVMMAYLGFGIYSLGMSGINVTWNVGSISFAPTGQGGYYQGGYLLPLSYTHFASLSETSSNDVSRFFNSLTVDAASISG